MRLPGTICWSCTMRIRNTSRRSHALELPPVQKVRIQHHRAHVASVLAERGAWEKQGGRRQLRRHRLRRRRNDLGRRNFCRQHRGRLRTRGASASAVLPGGDAAAQYPVQAAAGFLAQMEDLPRSERRRLLSRAIRGGAELVRKGRAHVYYDVRREAVRAAAALLGFTARSLSRARRRCGWRTLARSAAQTATPYPFPFERVGTGFPAAASRSGWRPACAGAMLGEIARAFQRRDRVGVSLTR